MNYRTAMKLLGLLAAALMAIATLGVTAPAQATTDSVNGDRCHNRGVTNYYVHRWQPVYPQVILDSKMVFHEHRCWVNGFRLYKSSANTPAEVRFARNFLAGDRPEKPTIFCRTNPGHAYFLDLAFYWADIKPLNAAERHHYTGWAHAYAERHDCRLFLPKAG